VALTLHSKDSSDSPRFSPKLDDLCTFPSGTCSLPPWPDMGAPEFVICPYRSVDSRRALVGEVRLALAIDCVFGESARSHLVAVLKLRRPVPGCWPHGETVAPQLEEDAPWKYFKRKRRPRLLGERYGYGESVVAGCWP